MDYTKIDTGELQFSNWTVRIVGGKGTVADVCSTKVADFEVSSCGHVTLLNGENKFADLALIALRSFVRYGCPETV
jgi:hypothetical protein